MSDHDAFFERVVEMLPHASVEKLGDHGVSISAGASFVCDFCSQIYPKDVELKRYPTHSFTTPTVPGGPEYMSEGDWGACADCAAFIDADDRKALLERSVEQAVRKYGNWYRHEARRSIKVMHGGFFRNRVREN